jgi:hypothetical protein
MRNATNSSSPPAFLSVGTKNTLDEDDQRYIMTVVDEQIDSMGRSLLGLTLACAKCHDHKFDPIPTRDYYALAGILRSSEPLAGAWRRHFAKWTQGVQPLAGAPVTFTDEDLAEQLKAASARMGLGGKIYRAQRAAVQEAGMQKAGKDRAGGVLQNAARGDGTQERTGPAQGHRGEVQ